MFSRKPRQSEFNLLFTIKKDEIIMMIFSNIVAYLTKSKEILLQLLTFCRGLLTLPSDKFKHPACSLLLSTKITLRFLVNFSTISSSSLHFQMNYDTRLEEIKNLIKTLSKWTENHMKPIFCVVGVWPETRLTRLPLLQVQTTHVVHLFLFSNVLIFFVSWIIVKKQDGKQSL